MAKKKHGPSRKTANPSAPIYSGSRRAQPRKATCPRIDPKVKSIDNRPDHQARVPPAGLINPGERASMVWDLQIALETDEVNDWGAGPIADSLGDITSATLVNIRHGRVQDTMSLNARKIAAGVGCDLFLLPQDVPYSTYIKAAEDYQKSKTQDGNTKVRFNLAIRVCHAIAAEIKKLRTSKSKNQQKKR